MAFKEKVMKALVELGEERTIKEVSNGISTRAFFDLKEKFAKLQKEIQEKHDNRLIKTIEEFEKKLKQSVEEEVRKQLKNEPN